MELSDQDYIYSNYNFIPMKLINDFIENSTKEVKSTAEKLFNECAKKLEEEKKEEDQKDNESPQAEPPQTEKKKKKGGAGKSGKNVNKKNTTENKYKAFLEIKYPRTESEKIMNNFIDNPSFEFINEKRDTLKDVFEDRILQELKSIFDLEIRALIKLKEKQDNTVDVNSQLKLLNNSYAYLKLIKENISKVENYFKSSDEKRALKSLVTYLCKNEVNIFMKDLMVYEIAKNKLTMDIHKLDSYAEREKILNLFNDHETRNSFTSLNKYGNEKNYNDFMEELDKYIKEKKIEISYDGSKEKEQINKIENDLKKLINDTSIDKGNKTDYKLYYKHIIYILNLLLVYKNLYFKLPNEYWIFSVCKTILNIDLFKQSNNFDFSFGDFYKMIENKKENGLEQVFNENKDKFLEFEQQFKSEIK